MWLIQLNQVDLEGKHNRMITLLDICTGHLRKNALNTKRGVMHIRYKIGEKEIRNKMITHRLYVFYSNNNRKNNCFVLLYRNEPASISILTQHGPLSTDDWCRISAANFVGSQYWTRGSCSPPVNKHEGYFPFGWQLLIGLYSIMYWWYFSSFGFPI